MGIYGALSTAVSGLRAQSFALETISGNIANSQTIGYKRVETEFVDLIADAPVKRQTPGAVLAQSRSTNNVRGDVKAVSNETYMALNGPGFFVVEPPVGETDGTTIFAGTNYYTRRGDFDINREGYLVNGSGYFLKALPIDTSTGNISGSVPQVIQLSNSFLPAEQTSRIDYQANLPQQPKNAAFNDGGSGLYTGSAATVTGAGEADFLEQSISGGAITTYAENGAPVDVQMRWAKTANADAAATPPVLDTWKLYYLSNSDATGTTTKWTQAGGSYTFDAAGAKVTPAATSTTISNLTVNGVSVGDVELRHGTGGMTQFADSNGTASVNASQNGYAAGEFVSVAVNDGGRIVASYTNGQQVEVGQVVVANFNAVNQLKKLDGGVFAATSESGEASLDMDGDGVIGSSVESSNTDISEEFTKLIVTQQAYSAGTRIVTTADEMLQEALNMVR